MNLLVLVKQRLQNLVIRVQRFFKPSAVPKCCEYLSGYLGEKLELRWKMLYSFKSYSFFFIELR